MKKRIWILTILVTILCIGGCSTKSKEPTKEEQEAMKIEQDRMVEYLYTHYEDIREVEFTYFEKNNKTGSWTVDATVNNRLDVKFRIRGILNTNAEIGFGQHTTSKNQELIEKKDVSQSEGIQKVKIKYFEGETK